MKNYDKIAGSLLGAAIGDAMGAAPASRTTELIRRDFGGGGFIYDYKELLPDCTAFDMPRGAVTEGFSGAYVFADHICKNRGVVTPEVVKEALFDWKDGPTKQYYEKYAGPTTRRGVAIIEQNYRGDQGRDHLLFECRTATCGAAVRAWISGLFHHDDVEKAIADAFTIGYITHDNPISLAAGAALAGAVVHAQMEEATLASVLDGAVASLEQAYRQAWSFCRPSSGASIIRRLDLAIETGIRFSNDFEKCIRVMNDRVGLGELASESVPSALGFFTAADGDVMKTVYLSINAGNNCDTVAMLGAALAGAYKGRKSIPGNHLEFLSEVNHMDIAGLAHAITNL